MRWNGATGAIARCKRVSTGCGRKRRSVPAWPWICGVKPKPKAVNKPSPHSIVHGLDKPGAFTTVSSPSTFNFHLQSTSPAIDAGTTLASVMTDYDGVTRPQGSAYDIGAYEYATAATPTPSTTANPVALYTFDNTANDSSGNGNNGTLVGSPT